MDFSSSILAQIENCRPFRPSGSEPVSPLKYHTLRQADAASEVESERRNRPRIKMSKAIGAAFVKE